MQASNGFGEVSPQAGGVIVPVMYKLPLDLSGTQQVRRCFVFLFRKGRDEKGQGKPGGGRGGGQLQREEGCGQVDG